MEKSNIQKAFFVSVALKGAASPLRAKSSATFFKTGEGHYSHGDKFMGVTVPQQRLIVRQFSDLPLVEAVKLLQSDWHEERLTALLILVSLFQRAKDERGKEAVVKAYLKNLKWVNNWDLVDSSAHQILGAWLADKSRAPLYKLVKSKVLWERRVAMVATYHFITQGDHVDAVKLAEALLKDDHDLMHKASGWMLREVGKRVDVKHLRAFLEKHSKRMPRTMLRYSIEHLPPAERKRWMAN
jgi:3-methyladenine DNA glycosylase AlkD